MFSKELIDYVEKLEKLKTYLKKSKDWTFILQDALIDVIDRLG